jgi:hypothetical protein
MSARKKLNQSSARWLARAETPTTVPAEGCVADGVPRSKLSGVRVKSEDSVDSVVSPGVRGQTTPAPASS